MATLLLPFFIFFFFSISPARSTSSQPQAAPKSLSIGYIQVPFIISPLFSSLFTFSVIPPSIFLSEFLLVFSGEESRRLQLQGQYNNKLLIPFPYQCRNRRSVWRRSWKSGSFFGDFTLNYFAISSSVEAFIVEKKIKLTLVLKFHLIWLFSQSALFMVKVFTYSSFELQEKNKQQLQNINMWTFLFLF